MWRPNRGDGNNAPNPDATRVFPDWLFNSGRRERAREARAPETPQAFRFPFPFGAREAPAAEPRPRAAHREPRGFAHTNSRGQARTQTQAFGQTNGGNASELPQVFQQGLDGLQGIFEGAAGHSMQAQQAAAAMAEAFGFVPGTGADPPRPFPQATQAPPRRTGPPPASRSVLRNLPEVKVSQVDLETDGNESCCICMEDHELGEMATKLPCGHIFHTECIKDWLQRHCTCPVCRFELPTEDAGFEEHRRERMGGRKRKYRRRELESKSVREIKHIMMEIGVRPPPDALMKSDLIQVLIDSEQIQLLPDTDGAAAGAEPSYGHVAREQDNRKYSPEQKQSTTEEKVDEAAATREGVRRRAGERGSGRSGAMPTAPSPRAAPRQESATEVLSKKSVSELRSIMRERGISLQGCIEKSDMVQKIVDRSRRPAR